MSKSQTKNKKEFNDQCYHLASTEANPFLDDIMENDCDFFRHDRFCNHYDYQAELCFFESEGQLSFGYILIEKVPNTDFPIFNEHLKRPETYFLSIASKDADNRTDHYVNNEAKALTENLATKVYAHEPEYFDRLFKTNSGSIYLEINDIDDFSSVRVRFNLDELNNQKPRV